MKQTPHTVMEAGQKKNYKKTAKLHRIGHGLVF